MHKSLKKTKKKLIVTFYNILIFNDLILQKFLIFRKTFNRGISVSNRCVGSRKGVDMEDTMKEWQPYSLPERFPH